ncbi:MAG TPA: hypothetical protein VMB71_05325, partial [Acetobacteraceae bacterium]|nr:hypothetical protein [Acetobacteraceae bacterium]
MARWSAGADGSRLGITLAGAEIDAKATQRRKYFFFEKKVTAQVGRKGEQARKDFFSEEKKQKTFISCVQPPVQIGGFGCQPQRIKVFCFFFSKKKAFFFCPERHGNRGPGNSAR